VVGDAPGLKVIVIPSVVRTTGSVFTTGIETVSVPIIRLPDPMTIVCSSCTIVVKRVPNVYVVPPNITSVARIPGIVVEALLSELVGFLAIVPVEVTLSSLPDWLGFWFGDTKTSVEPLQLLLEISIFRCWPPALYLTCILVGDNKRLHMVTLDSHPELDTVLRRRSMCIKTEDSTELHREELVYCLG
jgi:hypothetical protein